MKSIYDALLRWQSLYSLLSYFKDEEVCEEFLLGILYPDGIRCPKCGGIVIYRRHGDHTSGLRYRRHGDRATGLRYHCDECNSTFSIKVGTIFQSTKLSLRIWFAAIWLVINNKKSVSASMLSRELGITYATAWHLRMKLRKILPQSLEVRSSPEPVQVDAAYLGGRLRWIGHRTEDTGLSYRRHGDRATRFRYLRNKVSVLGLATSDNMYMRVINEGSWKNIRPILESRLVDGDVVYTDKGMEFSRIGMDLGLIHHTCNHDKHQYVAPTGATTNRIEGAWSHLKRNIYGIHHLLTRKYAQYYIDEFVYRYNTRDYDIPDRVLDFFGHIRVVVTWEELKK